MIKLINSFVFHHPESGSPLYRCVKIHISDSTTTLEWNVGNLPLDGDLLPLLDARFAELWEASNQSPVIVPDVYEYLQSIKTPAIYADDVFVSSRDIKDDPNEAFMEAIRETGKAKGEPKSLDLISRSALKALERAREEIVSLKREIKTMADEIKDIKKKIK